MKIKTAEFIKSYSKIDDFESDNLFEFAFVGRSNVGKSSLINALTNRRKLAKTSSMPGRTRLINTFLINNEFKLVDLPGYGYAKASKSLIKEWQPLIEGYLNTSLMLKNVFILLDSRHEPSELDVQMINFLYARNLPFTIIATKSDKLKKSELNLKMNALANFIGVGLKNIIISSAEDKKGIEEILLKIEQSLNEVKNNESLGN